MTSHHHALYGAISLSVLLLSAVAAWGLTGDSRSAAVKGSGPVTSETRRPGDFTRIAVSHGVRLDLVVGTPTGVEVTAQENLLPIISTTIADGRLTIDTVSDYTTDDPITVAVTVPAIEELALAGGASGHADGVRARSLSVTSVSGGRLSLSGQADILVLRASGGADLDLSHFTAKDATFDLSGGIRARVAVTGTARGNAVGGVALTLSGHPATIAVTTSAGAVVGEE